MNAYNFDRSTTSAKTLANASEVVARVIVEVAGNDLSNKLGNSSVTLSSIRSLALARFQRNLKISNVPNA
jgi:hypothetical protein